jgi:ketosteroid isomerase-like protein
MTIASDLLRRHFETLVADNAQWQTLIADDLVWELPFAPAIGHPARLSGRVEAVRHVTWFLGAVENFRFFDLEVHPFADPEAAVAEVKAEALIKPTGRLYRQEYVVFLRAAGGKIVFLREYFDPNARGQALTRDSGLRSSMSDYRDLLRGGGPDRNPDVQSTGAPPPDLGGHAG